MTKRRYKKEMDFVRKSTALTIGTGVGMQIGGFYGGTIGKNFSSATKMMGVIPVVYAGGGLIDTVSNIGSTPKYRRRRRKK